MTVIVRDPSSVVEASGRSVVYEEVNADVRLSGQARSTEPFQGTRGNVDKWVRWAGVQTDGDDLLLFAPANEVPSLGDGAVPVGNVLLRATLADAVREAEPDDLVIELRVDRDTVTGVWSDGVFAPEAEVVSVVNLRGVEIQHD